jgi:hypothetical protein
MPPPLYANHVVSHYGPLRDSIENTRDGRNQFAAAGLRSLNPYQNPIDPLTDPERQQKILNHYGSCPPEKFQMTQEVPLTPVSLTKQKMTLH